MGTQKYETRTKIKRAQLRLVYLTTKIPIGQEVYFCQDAWCLVLVLAHFFSIIQSRFFSSIGQNSPSTLNVINESKTNVPPRCSIVHISAALLSYWHALAVIYCLTLLVI